MKIVNGRLGTYVSDLTGTIVEKGISNPTTGVYSRDKMVLLPQNHRLKQLGIDYIELSAIPKNQKTSASKHIWVGKLVKEKDTEGKINTYRKIIVEGSQGKGFQRIRDFIKMIKQNNVKVN